MHTQSLKDARRGRLKLKGRGWFRLTFRPKITGVTILLLVLSAVFAGLAVLPFNVFEVRLFWLASVVVTEYGQHLAILAAAGLVVSIARRSIIATLAALGFASSLVVFLRPTVELYAGLDGWQRQLRRAFGGSVAESHFTDPDPLRLFLGSVLQTKITPRTITYVERAGEPMALDLYRPEATRPAPWVLVVHGGGWDSGDRTQMPELNSYLAHRGIGVVSVDYRLAPKSPWPAARDDVLEAARFVRAHATEYGLDPARWVIFGRSAGGHLAEAVAYGKSVPGLRGCVSLYAPSDMFKAYDWGAEDDILGSRQLIRDFMGGPPERLSEAYREASPLDLVSKASPPTLLMHGGSDPLVWVRHSERLRDRLAEKAVPNALIELPWGTHGFDYNLWGPGGQAMTTALTTFLKLGPFAGDDRR